MNSRNIELIKRYASHPMRSQVENALATAEVFAETLKSIRADKNLSDEGRANKIKASTRSALRDVRDLAEPITGLKKKLASIMAEIKPTAFDKTDVVGAMMRQSIRAMLKSMTLAEKAALLTGESADPAFVDSVLEGPALLSGLDASLYERVREHRISTLFTQESFQVEALTEQIKEAESAMQLARDDVGRAAGMPAHEFTRISDEIATKRNAPWLQRRKRDDGSEYVVVVPLQGGGAKIADETAIREGKFYRDFAEYQADRVA
jgi:hypothetical protein